MFIFSPYLYAKVIISVYGTKGWGILSMIFGIFYVCNSLSSDTEQQDFPPVSSQSKIRLHREATGFLLSSTLGRVQFSTSLIYLLFWQVGSANFNTKPKLAESHMFRTAFYFLVFIAKNSFNFNGMWVFWSELHTSSVWYQAISNLTGYMALESSSHFVQDATYFRGQKSLNQV